jgi:NAD(P)-dependent dehydrogenase (short-subunit alcohol dehydrogenase family)
MQHSPDGECPTDINPTEPGSPMKTVLITGTNRGLGLEFVRQYLKAGWRVVATVRDPGKATPLEALAGTCPDGRLTVLPLDAADAASRAVLADHLKAQPLDLLINNAGVSGGWGELGKLDESRWLDVFNINCVAPVKLTELLLPNLRAAGDSTVVMLSSKMGSMGDNTSGGSHIYRSSKAALNASARSLAIDLAPLKVKVAILHPGWVRTDMGGPNGLIDAETSVSGMRKVIAALSRKQAGTFIAYDGALIPW